MTKSKENPTLEQAIADVTAEQITNRIAEFVTEFDGRSAHENTMNSGNTSIQDKLKAARARFEVPGIAALSLATNLNPAFVNRQSAGDKRFNIYAVQKLADLMHGLNTGVLKNQINVCVLKSIFAFEKANMPFNGVAAQAAASDKVKIEKGMGGLLTRHAVSASTAPTQASSTMNALLELGIVRNTGTRPHPVFVLNDTPQTTKLRAMMAA